jgi:hypothetical protein
MEGAKGTATAVGVIVLLLVLVVHLGPVMTWLMIGLAVTLGLYGLPVLQLAARFRRWRKSRGW